MDKRIKAWINIMFFTLLFMVLMFLLIYNAGKFNEILILASILLASIIVRYLIFYENAKYLKYGKINMPLDLILIFILCIFDESSISKILFLIIIGDSVIFYSKKYSFFITIFSYILFIFSGYFIGAFSVIRESIFYIFSFTFGIIAISCVMLLIKYLINQKQKLTLTMEELEDTNRKLSEAYKDLEQLTKIKERNRIAAEVHDTVGHILTNVLVEIEAGKVCISKNSSEAIEKFQLAEEQIRVGLKQLIKSIRNINDNKDEVSFETLIWKLIDEIRKYSEVVINTNISINKKIPGEIGEALIKSFREGVTNGIRHGGATEFNLTIITTDENINLHLIDNGIGCKEIKPDYGINAIYQRVEDLKGKVEFYSELGKSFSMKIKIPF